jgi:NADPH:quinone reductase-like Zn-dependent oxidoreductase
VVVIQDLFVVISICNLIAVPENASSQDIVYLLSTYMTAYQCLERSLEVNQTSCCVRPTLKMTESKDNADNLLEEDDEWASPSARRRRSPLFGKSVLIAGAGSPVGLALVDVARHAGATVYALSHSQHEYNVKQMGVKGGWYPLFQKDAWARAWRGKMDVIVDTVGDYDNYTCFYDVMVSGGRFVRVNITSCGKKFVPVVRLGMQGGDEFFPCQKITKEAISTKWQSTATFLIASRKRKDCSPKISPIYSTSFNLARSKEECPPT